LCRAGARKGGEKRGFFGFFTATTLRRNGNATKCRLGFTATAQRRNENATPPAITSRRGGNLQKTLRIRCVVASLRWKLSNMPVSPKTHTPP
jgi:hypothetical protein